MASNKSESEEILRQNADLEQRVRERTAQLEAINKELEAFAYSVSHDLRAPLRSIRGFTEVILDRYAGQMEPEGQEFLKRICASSAQMDRLIEDLLKLSRLSRTDLRVQVVNLSAIAANISDELARSDPQRKVQVEIEPGLTAAGDERLLRIVLDNLFRNAWKFTGKKPAPRIRFAKEPGTQAFFVQDNGAGFDMKYAGRLFGVFQRLHSPAEFPGTGIGLATVQRIVNRHGGKVWAEGHLEKGATFYFCLPENRK